MKIKIDKKAVEIEITKEQMGDEWTTLVAGLKSTLPMYLITAIRAVIAERRVRERAELDAYIASLAAAEAAASQPMTADRPLPEIQYCWGLLDEFSAEKAALDARSAALVERNRQVRAARLAAARAIDN